MKLIHFKISSFLSSITYSFVVLVIVQGIILAQPDLKDDDASNFSADIMKAKSESEIPTAEAKSLFNLAKENISLNTVHSRKLAREYLQKAILLEPGNIEFRLCYASLLEKYFPVSAYSEYENILQIDSTCIEALYKLALRSESEFNEWKFSQKKFDDGIYFDLSDEALSDFRKAEYYYKKIISCQPQHYDALMHLSFLYEDSNAPEKSIPLLETLLKAFPDDKDVHLYLGLLYYKDNQIQKAHKEFQEALILMQPEERKDFTYNTVIELLSPVLSEKIKNFSQPELENLISSFWKLNEPLFLTEYNERLLEHYSRVAYTNLRYSVLAENKQGWKTDRGEMHIRYGDPNKIVRLRPGVDWSVVKLKTEIWHYKEFELGFVDKFSTNKYVFSSPPKFNERYQSQFGYDTFFFVESLRKISPQKFEPVFEGPPLDIPVDVTQFLSLSANNKTDVYFSYKLEHSDSQECVQYQSGIFFFDLFMNPIYQKKDDFEFSAGDLNDGPEKNSLVKSSLMIVKPDSGNISFEILRTDDGAAYSNQGRFKVRKFYRDILEMSDIVLAETVESADTDQFPIIRENLGIKPNPELIFSSIVPLFIFYETYNLELGADGMNNIEQTILLKRSEDETSGDDLIAPIIKMFQTDEKQVALVSNFQTRERNPQIYFQLDMSEYESGKYELEIKIKDLISGNEVFRKKEFFWNQ
jgi:GWxTD domain-containing protein